MAKEKDGIDFSQTEDLVKFGSEKSKLLIIVALFIGLSCALTVHALYSIFTHWTDKSIPLVICPKSFDLDAPVLMTPVNQSDSVFVQDRWIRGFVRRVVLNSYPRTAEDMPRFFQNMKDMSEGSVARKYESFLNDIERIQTLIRGGNRIRFYVKNSNDMKIRPTEGRKDQWVVEIDGYLIKDIGGIQQRSTPTLRYTIETRPATRTNPSGLVVVDANMEQIADYVSGRLIQEQEEVKK